jgi:hypothetical protein
MKKLILALVIAGAVACSQSQTQQVNDNTQYFGDKITAENAIPVSELKEKMGDHTQIEIKVEGEIEEVCQKKGCWMKLKIGDRESIRITFKDYGFFMPLDASGRIAIAEGIAIMEETSIADLREYAKDAGKSQEEIDAITEPEYELVFEASGVIIK